MTWTGYGQVDSPDWSQHWRLVRVRQSHHPTRLRSRMCFWDHTWRFLATEGCCNFQMHDICKLQANEACLHFPDVNERAFPQLQVSILCLLHFVWILFIYFKCLLTFRCTNGHPWSLSVIPAEEWGVSLAQCVGDFLLVMTVSKAETMERGCLFLFTD